MKKIGFAFISILIIFLLFAVFFRPTIDGQKLFPQQITKVFYLNKLGDLTYLNDEELEQFNRLIKEATYKKKLIPNIQKFYSNIETALMVQSGEQPSKSDLLIDFERSIIGIRSEDKKIKQYFVDENEGIIKFIKEI